MTKETLAQQEQPAQEAVAREGAEDWEPLAWHLCAEENGEEACSELIWEGGAIPEPWGDRWLKYEHEAKRMIATVKKFAPPTQPAQEPVAWMVYNKEGTSVMVTDNPTDISDGMRALPLYTAPPTQPALSDEQILDIFSKVSADGMGHYMTAVGRAIEAHCRGGANHE